MRAHLLAVLMLSACVFGCSGSSNRFGCVPCTDSSVCASGLSCVEGYCATSPSDAERCPGRSSSSGSTSTAASSSGTSGASSSSGSATSTSTSGSSSGSSSASGSSGSSGSSSSTSSGSSGSSSATGSSSGTTGIDAGCPSVGNLARNSSYDANVSRTYLSRYTAGAARTLTAMRMTMSGNFDGGAQQLELVIYADDGGQPTELLGQTAPFVVSGLAASAQLVEPLENPVDVAPGNYWLGLVAGGPTGYQAEFATIVRPDGGYEAGETIKFDAVGSNPHPYLGDAGVAWEPFRLAIEATGCYP